MPVKIGKPCRFCRSRRLCRKFRSGKVRYSPCREAGAVMRFAHARCKGPCMNVFPRVVSWQTWLAAAALACMPASSRAQQPTLRYAPQAARQVISRVQQSALEQELEQEQTAVGTGARGAVTHAFDQASLHHSGPMSPRRAGGYSRMAAATHAGG